MPHRERPILILPDSLVSIFEESPRHRSRAAKTTSELKELRRLEFELGRSLAHQALIQAGFQSDHRLDLSPAVKSHHEVAPGVPNKDNPLPAVGKNSDRSPSWPVGFVGSISHSDRWVWVAVARAVEFMSIGIDTEVMVEPTRALELRSSVGCDQEWQCLASQRFTDSIAFTLLFSAKEAFFKLCYPLTKIFWEFQDLEVVSVQLDSQLQNPLAAEGLVSSGKIFLRCRNQNAESNGRDLNDLESALSSNLKHDFLVSPYPVMFQVIGQDVFTFAMIRQL